MDMHMHMPTPLQNLESSKIDMQCIAERDCNWHLVAETIRVDEHRRQAGDAWHLKFEPAHRVQCHRIKGGESDHVCLARHVEICRHSALTWLGDAFRKGREFALDTAGFAGGLVALA